MPFVQTKSNLNVFYNMVGSGDRTIVLIHGMGSTCRHWSMQLKPLIEAGFKVITYDVRGHGATLGTEGPYSIKVMSDDLEELLEAIGVEEKVYLFGISMGGLIAQEFILNNPEKVHAAIISNTYSFLGYDALAAGLGVEVETLKQQEITNQTVYEVLSKGMVENWDVAEHMMAAANLLMTSEIGENLFFDDMMFQTQEERVKTQAATASFDSRDRLDQIKCPVLVIGSENDMIVPFSESAYLHEHIAGSQYVVMKNMNHVPTMDDHVLYNQYILSFLNSVSV